MRLEFKAGMIGAPRRYEIRDGVIRRLDRAGAPKSTFAVSSVEELRYHESRAGSFISRTLEISGRGEKLVLVQSMPARRMPRSPEVAAFLRAVSATLSAVAEVKPGLPVHLNHPAWYRWFLFVIFTLGVLGLLVLISLVLDRRDASELWWVTAVLGAGAAFAAFMAWRGRPWRETETVTLSEFLTSLGQPSR